MRFFVTDIICCLFFLFFVSVCVADSAAVRSGTDAFHNGDFDQAAKEFGKAAENAPKDLRLTYNHGIALAAAGDFDNAINVLSKSAIDRNPKIAVLSLNALAQIYIDKARKQLPENQNETPPDKQNEIRELTAKAEQYYIDILAVEPENQNAKQNIEQLRAWRAGIESRWDQANRNQQRQKMLYDRLDWIDGSQRDVVNSISQLKEQPNSPKKYQTFYESAEKQKQLINEIDVLRDDLKKQFAADNTNDNTEFFNTVDKIRETAAEVKQSLDNFDETDSQKKADLSNKQLNRLKFSFAPFEKIVEQAEKMQTQLVNNNPFSTEPDDKNENKENKENNNQNIRNDNSDGESDLQRQIYDQQLISSLMPLMLARAKEGIESAKTQDLQSQPNQPEADQRQKSMELAIKYAPEIQQLTANAANLLTQNKHKTALPDQKQAQKLLREILNQQNQNQEQNQEQNNQNKNDDQNKENEQKNNDQNNSQSQQQSENAKQDENKNNATEAEKLRQEEKAERLMRLVKRKQQEANERREELRYQILKPAPVDKDW
ncbi:MAG: hypothetical protein LBT09_11500 [Planctomycetaceae bacterium]|jgi:hypothetical protein|nr:hypothetical protein [Planctomycetaceae bacterium]